MQIGTRAQVITNVVTHNISFLAMQKGVVIDSENGVRAGIDGQWSQLKMDSDVFAVPYWFNDLELKEL